jgi:hypothetical protein
MIYECSTELMIDRRILITCSLLTFKYPEISNVRIMDWPAIGGRERVQIIVLKLG